MFYIAEYIFYVSRRSITYIIAEWATCIRNVRTCTQEYMCVCVCMCGYLIPWGTTLAALYVSETVRM